LDFIKIDVEGAEHLVIRGAQQTLERLRPTMVFEYNEEAGAEAYKLLENLGYGLFDLEERPMELAKARLHDVLAVPRVTA
jgi:hypothetical protein